MSKMLLRLGHEKDVVHVLKHMAKPLGMVVVGKKCNELNDLQALAIYDHMKSITQVMKHLVQGLKVFLPDADIFPSNISKVMRELEKNEVIPSALVSIPDCIITKAGNKRGMCNFYYCIRPSEFLANMINLGRKDGAWRDSLTFSSLVKKVVVTVGFDKSDSDFSWYI
jgi:hypothetical protein